MGSALAVPLLVLTLAVLTGCEERGASEQCEAAGMHFSEGRCIVR